MKEEESQKKNTEDTSENDVAEEIAEALNDAVEEK